MTNSCLVNCSAMASAAEDGGEEVQAVSEWNDLTIQQLKEELIGRGLETTGRKADLVARLDASDKGKCLLLSILVLMHV